MNKLACVSVTLLSLVACGVDPAKIPHTAVYAKDAGTSGEVVDAGSELVFAVVGATRTGLPGVPSSESDVAASIIADVKNETPVRGLSFVALTGDFVKRSSNQEWARFATRWGDTLKSDVDSNNTLRLPVMPVPGAGEFSGDARLKGFGGAFPDAGASIGYNRVGSWGSIDTKIDGDTWRFIFLDTHEAALGSRWQEELFWLPKVVTGEDYDHLVVFMPDPLVTLAQGTVMNPDDAPSTLLGIIDDNAGVAKLMAVFSGGGATNEVYLPSGSFGEAYINAGNSGIPGQNLARWGAADKAKFRDVQLEALFDLSLMGEFDRQNESKPMSETVVDQAKARNSFATYTGIYSGADFPVQGWWIADVKKKTMSATYRMRRADGTFRDIYTIAYGKKDGWVGQSLK